uniref:receptor protein-tyrosine kinase n=1 Tax=Timema californicum TaxID=61474 RepID=A0A7R9J6Z6_TIMCA|nr:unnamed protein product [Timema californicum]
MIGLNAELFYVRDGVVNDYALNFSVPVPAHISELYFIWQSLTGMPLPYVVKLKVSDNEALVAPLLNISHTGHIPVVAEAFMVSLSCSKAVDAEVDVILNLNISLNKLANNITTLTFRRKKICLKGEERGSDSCSSRHLSGKRGRSSAACALPDIRSSSPPLPSEIGYEMLTKAAGGETASGDSRHVVVVDSESPPANTIYIAVGSACVLIVIIVVGMAAYYVHNSKAHHQQADALQSSVQLHRVVLEGTFGRVYQGSYIQGKDGPEEQVLVKTVTDHASQVQISLLLQEGMTMYNLHHKNILSVLGVSIEDHTAPYKENRESVNEAAPAIDNWEEVTPYPDISYVDFVSVDEDVTVCGEVTDADIVAKVLTNNIQAEGEASGDEEDNSSIVRKRFLQMCKLCPEGVAHTLTTQEVVGMALQIIQGMQFLHKKHLLHRDLATRNCVVDPEFHVRITEQALARDLFPADYHCLGDNFNRPVKWLAIESLVHNTFSTVSDVWSYGVLLWELTTLAQQPYVEIDPFEMAAYLRDGYRLSQPINCPDELFAVMAYCWAMSPDERPTFSQLQICLQDFYKQLTKYV